MKMWSLRSWLNSTWVVAVLIALLALYNFAKAQPKADGSLSNLARVSGTVTSPSEFKAARVYFRNPDKRMLYMVYTNAGKFQAMNLMPGNYEVSVQTTGLESDIQKVELKAGNNATVNLSLHPAPSKSGNVQMLSYEEIYPKGEARTIVERTCIGCHGPNFVPSHQWSAEQWNSAIDLMMEGDAPAIPAQILPKEKREILVDYLVKNFGPNSEVRSVTQAGMPVDETKISKAEYIEFYFPLDGPGVGNNDPQYAAAPHKVYGGRRTGQDVVLDQQGHAWATDRGTPNRLVRLDPRTDEWMSFLMPHPTKGIHDFIIDTDGVIWVPEWYAPPAQDVVAFDTKTLKWIAAYPMDPDHLIKGVSHTQAIVIDSKHNMYMNWNWGSAMSRLDWQTKKATVTLMPNPRSFLYGVVKDSKDNIWISEFRGGKIARMDAVTHQITEYTPPTYPALIRRLTVGSHDMVWFDLFSAGRIDRLDPNTGKITEWAVPYAGSQPYSLKQALGSNKMWVSDGGAGGALLLFDPDTGSFTVYPTPQITDQPLLRIARDGAVWYCPRSSENAGIGVMYPDMTKMTTLAAYPTDVNPNY
jgi:streptogramin lyase